MQSIRYSVEFPTFFEDTQTNSDDYTSPSEMFNSPFEYFHFDSFEENSCLIGLGLDQELIELAQIPCEEPKSPSVSSDLEEGPLSSNEHELPKHVSKVSQKKEKKPKKPANFLSSNIDKRKKLARPKVVESKGTVQCQGTNRKKGTQCRNAALMEYIGPRPIYCAEHVELDPNSLYRKCRAAIQPGDQKGCKEVVLKEFGVCFKHIHTLLEGMNREQISAVLRRCEEILQLLENEAAEAKKKDADLYQRKNKLIPKYYEMKSVILSFL